MTEEEIIFEIQKIGNIARINAVHVASSVEVVVSGPATSVEALKRTAIAKLHYVLSKKRP